MRKYIAELIGACVLVTMGCGTAMLVGCDAASGSGYALTALAFGLSIVAMAYCIGNISGCHINPAVSLGVLMSGRMSGKDFAGYVVAQIIGGLLGAALLLCIFGLGGVTDMTGGLGSNGFSGVNGSAGAAFLVEVALTFIFMMAVLGVTSPRFQHGSLAGLSRPRKSTWVNASRIARPAALIRSSPGGMPLHRSRFSRLCALPDGKTPSPTSFRAPDACFFRFLALKSALGNAKA